MPFQVSLIQHLNMLSSVLDQSLPSQWIANSNFGEILSKSIVILHILVLILKLSGVVQIDN